MAARWQHSGLYNQPNDRDYGAVYRCPGPLSSTAMFCSAPDLKTYSHINWGNIVASFASMSATKPNGCPPWADTLLQPSQSEPGIKHIRCKRSICRGDVLGFLLGIIQTSAQAETALSACSTPQDALGLASRMHTFRTPPAPGSPGSADQENILSRNEQLPRILTFVSSNGPGNPFAQMLETTEAPNAAVVMITNLPSGVLYFPVIALRAISAGEIITHKKAESSSSIALRAFMQAARSDQAPAAAAAAPADGLALCRSPPLQAAPVGTRVKVLGEVASAAYSTIQEVQYMLQAAVAACDIQAVQQEQEQQEAGGVQLLGQQLLKVNEQLQQAESLLAVTRQQPAVAAADGTAAAAPSGISDPVSAAAVEHPDTPDAEMAMQHAGNQQPVAAAAEAEFAGQYRPAARPSVGAHSSSSAGVVFSGPEAAAANGGGGVGPSVQAAKHPRVAAALSSAAGTSEPTAAAAAEAYKLPSPRALCIPVVAPEEPQAVQRLEPWTWDVEPLARSAAAAAPTSRKRLLEHTAAAATDDYFAASAAADSTSQPAQKRARKPSTKQQEQQAFEEEERKAVLRQQRRLPRQQSVESESPATAASGGSAGGNGSCSIRGSVALAGKAAAGVAHFTLPKAAAVGHGASDLQEQLQLLKAYATSSSRHPAQHESHGITAPVADGDAAAAAAAAAVKRLRGIAQEGKQQKGFTQVIPVLIKLLASTSAVLHVEAAAALEGLSLEEKHAPSISRGIPRFVELLTAYAPMLLSRDMGSDSNDSAVAAAPVAEAQRDISVDTAQQVVHHVSTLLLNLLEAVSVTRVISSSGGDKALLQLLDQVLLDLESSGSSEGRVSRSSNAWDLSSCSSSSKLDMLDPVLGSLRHMAYPSLDDDDVPREICAAGGVALFVRAVIGSTATIKHLVDQQLAAQQKMSWRNSSTSPGATGSPAAAAAGSADLCKETIQKLQLVQEHAVGALWNIARVSALQPKIHSSAAAAGGGMGPCDAVGTKALGYKQIVQCLSSDSPKVQYEACGLLQWLAVGMSACKTAIPEAGGIAPLVTILSTNGDGRSGSGGACWTDEQMELQGNAAGALWHLAEGSRNNQVAIAAAGAIPPLVKMLSGCKTLSSSDSSSLETMQREAAGTLRSLAANMPPIKDSIVKANGVAKLVGLLRSCKTANVLAVAAAALAEVVKGKPANQRVAVEAGAVAVLKALANNADRDVSASANAALELVA